MSGAPKRMMIGKRMSGGRERARMRDIMEGYTTPAISKGNRGGGWKHTAIRLAAELLFPADIWYGLFRGVGRDLYAGAFPLISDLVLPCPCPAVGRLMTFEHASRQMLV